MRRASALDSAGEELSSQAMNRLLETPACASTMTQSGGHGLASILYAEDDPLLRGFSVEILTHSGYAVTPVEDGLQAWAALHSKGYDLLITDNNMPRMTGLELAAKTRIEGMPQSYSHITPYQHWGLNE
jgi:PleD family two-component response regulator